MKYLQYYCAQFARRKINHPYWQNYFEVLEGMENEFLEKLKKLFPSLKWRIHKTKSP
jgi:hypothetical protein